MIRLHLFILCFIQMGLALTTPRAQARDYLQDDALLYHTPRRKDVIIIDENRWTNKFKDSSRFDFLIKFYSATTRVMSNTGQVHLACYTGNGKDIVNKFFNKPLSFKNFSRVYANYSVDQKTIGVTMIPSNKKLAGTDAYHFRMTKCDEAGKNHTFDVNAQTVIDLDRKPAQTQLQKEDEKLPQLPKAPKKLTGYEIVDTMSPESEKIANKLGLPRFKFRSEYSKYKVKDTDRPWKNIDITTEAGKEKFARDTLYFFLKGMADQSSRADLNFMAEKNKRTNWCHMPWMQVGDSGREVIHGLTKERDIESSAMYPNIEAGANWGIGYYNSVGCKTIGKIFGDASAPIAQPNFLIPFDDGTMSAKILFSTSPSKFLDGSYTLNAHVSTPTLAARSIQKLRMIQIDIAIKDSAVPGARAGADNWIMTTYYYDPTYTWDFAKEFKSKDVQGLMHMRPIGIQSGFDAATSTIFKGAIANSVDHVKWGTGKLLNGPGDNRKSSCMGCHGTAGTPSFTQFKMVPGVLDDAMFQSSKKNFNLDFSQQLAFAKRNFETQPVGEKEMPPPISGP